MTFERILVRATNWVGDAILSLPALEQVRDRYPRAYIAVLARPWVAGIYRSELVDEVIPYTVAKGWSDLPAKWRMARQLKEKDFDCAILFQNAFEAAAIVWLAGIPVRIGYNRDGRGLLLSDPIRVPAAGEIPPHERFYYLEMLRRAGLTDSFGDIAAENEGIRFPHLAELRAAGVRHLENLGVGARVVGVSPGAAFGTAKRWLPDSFAEAAARTASELGASVAVFGAADEKLLCERVAARVRAKGIAAKNFAGETSLSDFVEIAAACVAFLTNDSGAMHVASSAGVPTVAIFGPTDHIATGPTGLLARVVREPVPCSPCLLRECPIDHRCMTSVEAPAVSRELIALVHSARKVSAAGPVRQ